MFKLGIVVFFVSGVAAGATAQTVVPPTISMATRAPLWICMPDNRFDCTADGCKTSARPADGVGVILDFEQKAYGRCDAKGCDPYPLATLSSGIYTTAAPADRQGVFLKALNDGSEYVEVVTAGTTVLTSYGACRPHERSQTAK